MSSFFCNLLEYSNSSFWLRCLINRTTAYRLSPEFTCVTSKYMPRIFLNLRHIYYKTQMDWHSPVNRFRVKTFFFKECYRLKFSLSLLYKLYPVCVCPPTPRPPQGFLGFFKYIQFGKLNQKVLALTSYCCAVICVVLCLE